MARSGYISIFKKSQIKSGTSFQCPAFSKKTRQKCLLCITIVFDQVSFLQQLGFRRNEHKCNFHYAAMSMMASQILKLVDFTKIQKFRQLKYKALFFLQIKFINYRPRATLWHKPCRCHLSNIMPDIMPDSILYDSTGWGITCRFFQWVITTVFLSIKEMDSVV